MDVPPSPSAFDRNDSYEQLDHVLSTTDHLSSDHLWQQDDELIIDHNHPSKILITISVKDIDHKHNH